MAPDLSAHRLIGWNVAPATIAAIVVLLATYHALHTVLLASVLTSPVPIGDHWRLIAQYATWLDGDYGPLGFLRRHNEHIIVTTKLVLFSDALFLGMHGVLPRIVYFATTATIAVLLAHLTFGPKSGLAATLAASAIFTGFFWSTSQFLVIYWDFLIGFPLAHLFVIACLLALSLALVENSRSRWLWLGLAIYFDILAVISIGGGIFLIAPAVALAIWIRRFNLALLSFLAAHCALAILYWQSDGNRAISVSATFNPAAYFDFLIVFLGWPFRFWGAHRPAGMIELALFALAVGAFTWRAVASKRPVNRLDAILLAIACFAVLEGAAAAVTRYQFGVNNRYQTIIVLHLASMCGLFFRNIGSLPGGPAVRSIARTLALAAAGALTLVFNAPENEAAWRTRIASYEKATAAMMSGDYSPETMKIVTLSDRNIEQDMLTLEELRLGPFDDRLKQGR